MHPATRAGGANSSPKAAVRVNRSTITSVLLTTDGLPGEWVEWEPLLDVTIPPYDGEKGFEALGRIPFRDFPERGRREFEALLIPIEKLVPWLAKRGWTLPAFLARGGTKWQASDELGPRELGSPEPSRPVARSGGRPQKRAWPRILNSCTPSPPSIQIARRGSLPRKLGSSRARSSMKASYRR